MQLESNVLLGCYQKDPNMVYREIAGEALLVPIRNHIGDLNSIFTLNETASFIWAHIDGEQTLHAAVMALTAEYEIDEAQAEQDVLELIAQLVTVQAVQRV
jgi:hypothetical protein